MSKQDDWYLDRLRDLHQEAGERFASLCLVDAIAVVQHHATIFSRAHSRGQEVFEHGRWLAFGHALHLYTLRDGAESEETR